MTSLAPFRLRIIDFRHFRRCRVAEDLKIERVLCCCWVKSGITWSSTRREFSTRILRGSSLHRRLFGNTRSSKGSLGTSAASGDPGKDPPLHEDVREPITNEVTVQYSRGLPVITAPLPSRAEKCQFTLLPVSNTVGDFLHMLSVEDKGIDRAAVYSLDGIRISARTTIDALMEHDFDLIINDFRYRVHTPVKERLSQEQLTTLSHVRTVVAQLYESLQVDQHQLQKERQLLAKLEKLKRDLEPLEERNIEMAMKSDSQMNALTWLGLGFMAVQFGILARLTWWEYSWDIMEPVTYFVTYGTAMAAYAYFVLTRQEYLLPDVRDRQFLNLFHKYAKKYGLDVEKYNALKQQQSDVEAELRRLRDPLQLKLAPKSLESPLPPDFPRGILSTVRQELLTAPNSVPKEDPKQKAA